MTGVRRGARERRYRRALQFYPKRWRDRNADVVLSTLLDVADAEGRRSPRVSELLQLAASGLSTRLAVSISRRTRDQASTIAVATGALLAIAFAVVQGLPAPSPLEWSSARGFGPFLSPAIVLYSLWMLAFVLVLLGQRRAAKIVLALCLLAPATLWITRRSIEGLWVGPSLQTLVFLTMLAVLALLGTPRPTRWTGAGMLIGAGALVIAFRTIGAPAKSYMDEGTFWRLVASPYNLGTALAVLGVVVFSFIIAGRGVWSKTLFLSFVPWIAAWSVSVIMQFRWDGTAWLLAGLLAGIASRVLVRASRRSRSDADAVR